MHNVRPFFIDKWICMLVYNFYSATKPTGGIGGVVSAGVYATGAHGVLSPVELYADTQKKYCTFSDNGKDSIEYRVTLPTSTDVDGLDALVP